MAPLIRFCARWRGKRGARGAELVEFAFVLPLLLFVVLGIIDFGFLFHDYEVVTNAAREGSRLKSLADTYGDADVTARVQNYISFGGLDPNLVIVPPITAVSIPINAGGTVFASGNQVTVQYPHQLRFLGAISGFFNGSFGTVTLTASSTMRSEIQ
jgi:Flp pilus assembly protein TadG